MLGRKKFGSQGWSRVYNFNDGDLTICADVLFNYLTKYEVVPWADLRYIFGEIMYGGHITDVIYSFIIRGWASLEFQGALLHHS